MIDTNVTGLVNVIQALQPARHRRAPSITMSEEKKSLRPSCEAGVRWEPECREYYLKVEGSPHPCGWVGAVILLLVSFLVFVGLK